MAVVPVASLELEGKRRLPLWVGGYFLCLVTVKIRDARPMSTSEYANISAYVTIAHPPFEGSGQPRRSYWQPNYSTVCRALSICRPRAAFFISCALQLSHRHSVCLGDDHHLLPVTISPGIGPVRSGGEKVKSNVIRVIPLSKKSTGRNEISETWNGQPRIEYGCPLDACGLFGGSCFLCS